MKEQQKEKQADEKRAALKAKIEARKAAKAGH